MARFHRIAAAAVAFAALCLSAAPSLAETVTLVADEWCPYNCAPDSDRQGYLIEIARRALEPAGITVEYQTIPWKRAVAEVKVGTFNGAVGAIPGDYPTAVFPKEPMGYSGNVLAMLPAKAAGFHYIGPESLKGLRLGGAQGYSYDNGPIDAYIAAAGPAVELLAGGEVQSQNLRKLLAGRVDAFIDDNYVMRMTISEMQPKPELVLVPVGEPSVVSIGFSEAKPESRHYADLIDAYMLKARASGELAALLARYGVEDWKK